MNAIQLNNDWNADPNAPEVQLSVENDTVRLGFFLNYFLYERFKKDDKAIVIFKNCHKYSFNSMNDEGYFMGQYRYKNHDLPWGEFYMLDTDWSKDFPVRYNTLIQNPEKDKLNHYIFFFKDNTFECLAENFDVKFITAP